MTKQVKITPLSLAFAVVGVIVLTSLLTAQNTSSTPREMVLDEIRQYAQRHVDTGSPLQTELVLKLFEHNSVGLSAAEITTIYEKEYARIKKTLEPSLLNRLGNKLGPISLILAILLVIGNAIKAKLGILLGQVWDLIYSRLAGTRLLRGFALSRYRKALLAKFEKVKVAFRPNRPLYMEELYIPLRLVGSDDNTLIDSDTAIENYHRLMVVGRPGSGKTMLLKHLASTFAKKGFTNPRNRPIPILLDLHRLNDPKLSLEEHLNEEFARSNFPKANNFLLTNLRQGSLFLLFDGLDEVNSTERKRAVQGLKDLLTQYPMCRVAITCRNAVYKDEFSDDVDCTLELVEFTDQQIRNYFGLLGKGYDPTRQISRPLDADFIRPTPDNEPGKEPSNANNHCLSLHRHRIYTSPF